MAIGDMLRKAVVPLLPGENVQQVFVAQGGSNPLLLLIPATLAVIVGAVAGAAVGGPSVALLSTLVVGVLVLLVVSRFITRRIVAVTNWAVVVFTANWSGVKPTGLLVRLPRQTLIDPPQGNRRPITLGSEKLWVNRRFSNEIAAANAAVGTDAP
jgi:hypothetical protein